MPRSVSLAFRSEWSYRPVRSLACASCAYACKDSPSATDPNNIPPTPVAPVSPSALSTVSLLLSPTHCSAQVLFAALCLSSVPLLLSRHQQQRHLIAILPLSSSLLLLLSLYGIPRYNSTLMRTEITGFSFLARRPTVRICSVWLLHVLSSNRLRGSPVLRPRSSGIAILL